MFEIIRNQERGLTKTGWLDSHHSFSFGGYYNTSRINFGTLRVINEDTVAPGKGFGRHEHDNMEIVTIVLSGAVEHEDSMGNKGVIQAGQVQRMSAGSGITHSEYNASTSEPVHFLQIWVFPRDRDMTPSYEQASFTKEQLANKLYPIVASEPKPGSIQIHQDARFFLGHMDIGRQWTQQLTSLKHGAYLFVIKGTLSFEDKELKAGDAVQISQQSQVQFKALEPSDVLLIEVALTVL